MNERNTRRRVAGLEGRVAHLETQIQAAYDARNQKLRDEVIAPAVTQVQDRYTELDGALKVLRGHIEVLAQAVKDLTPAETPPQ